MLPAFELVCFLACFSSFSFPAHPLLMLEPDWCSRWKSGFCFRTEIRLISVNCFLSGFCCRRLRTDVEKSKNLFRVPARSAEVFPKKSRRLLLLAHLPNIAHRFRKSLAVDNYAQPVDILQCGVTGWERLGSVLFVRQSYFVELFTGSSP